MPRPMKWRRVCCMPIINRFGPLDQELVKNEFINLTIDEYETIRLIDLEGLTQEECADQMSVARTTVQGIYVQARRKIAEALVHGKILTITGGEYQLCDEFGMGCRRGCHKRKKEWFNNH